MSAEDRERPPLGSWRRAYAVVVGWLLACILLLGAFTAWFS